MRHADSAPARAWRASCYPLTYHSRPEDPQRIQQ
jgi:hypothetical protein